MANSGTYRHVIGADKLSAALRQLSEELRANVLERAMKEVCKPVLEAARRFAKRSERTGALVRSLRIKTVAYRNTGKAVGLVGPDRSYYSGGKRISKNAASVVAGDRPANYAHLVEYGHHVVTARKAKTQRVYKYTKKQRAALARTGDSAFTGATRVAMTFVPAKPFIRPAVVTTRAQQADAFQRGCRKGMEKALSKLSRK